MELIYFPFVFIVDTNTDVPIFHLFPCLSHSPHPFPQVVTRHCCLYLCIMHICSLAKGERCRKLWSLSPCLSFRGWPEIYFKLLFLKGNMKFKKNVLGHLTCKKITSVLKVPIPPLKQGFYYLY